MNGVIIRGSTFCSSRSKEVEEYGVYKVTMMRICGVFHSFIVLPLSFSSAKLSDKLSDKLTDL